MPPSKKGGDILSRAQGTSQFRTSDTLQSVTTPLGVVGLSRSAVISIVTERYGTKIYGYHVMMIEN
jgi:hypothetical protein